MAAIVVQFGLAMMPFGTVARIAVKLTSETTSGIGILAPGRRVVDDDHAGIGERGACTRDMVAPENSAMSSPAGSAVAASSTSISCPRNGNFLPAERAGRQEPHTAHGKSRSSAGSHHLADLDRSRHHSDAATMAHRVPFPPSHDRPLRRRRGPNAGAARTPPVQLVSLTSTGFGSPRWRSARC